ncbi:uncharacterized protein LOC143286887 isoform X2 [Babylonia areolata]|uniref:uncharacterized protein LOC143286887 isoform X2 n=1 Tax=Babylonia areolata TaxID=304850 RepID=UPI003FD0857D
MAQSGARINNSFEPDYDDPDGSQHSMDLLYIVNLSDNSPTDSQQSSPVDDEPQSVYFPGSKPAPERPPEQNVTSDDLRLSVANSSSTASTLQIMPLMPPGVGFHSTDTPVIDRPPSPPREHRQPISSGQNHTSYPHSHQLRRVVRNQGLLPRIATGDGIYTVTFRRNFPFRENQTAASPVNNRAQQAIVIDRPSIDSHPPGNDRDRLSNDLDHPSFGKRQCMRCLKRCCVVTFVLGFLAAFAVIIALVTVPGSGEGTYLVKAILDMRVKEPFHVDLQNLSSPRAVNYTNRIRQQVSLILENQTDVDQVQEFTVIQYSNGSTKVQMGVELLVRDNLSESDFNENVLAPSLQKKGDTLWVGNIPVDGTGMHVTNYSITGDVSRPPTTTPAIAEEFDCSVGGLDYKPNPDTFPDRCDSYQRCENGRGHDRECASGLEFGYDPQTPSVGPCRLPSSATYCSQKRAMMTTAATEPTMTSSTRMTSSTTVTASTGMTSSTTVTPSTSTAVTSLNCSSPELLPYVQNATDLYSCNKTGAQNFRAHSTTYPDNCGKYVWCEGGGVLTVRHCANGASYVYGGDEQEPCYETGDPRTFCARMELAKDCR